MFCTQCTVAFSWRTGTVVTNGVIHNPHYYEWMRRTRGEVPRQPGDVPCGGLVRAHDLESAMRRHGCSAEVTRTLRVIHRLTQHVLHVDLPDLRRLVGGDAAAERRNADLRLKYLLNQIDEQEWRTRLQQREKKRERAFAVCQVYDMFTAAATDIFRALVATNILPHEAVDQLHQLQAFSDEGLTAIAKRFNMRVKRLRE